MIYKNLLLRMINLGNMVGTFYCSQEETILEIKVVAAYGRLVVPISSDVVSWEGRKEINCYP